jgi:Fe-S oxidoreductase
MDNTPTRTVFQGMAPWECMVFYGLSLVSVGLFIWGCYRLMRRYRTGRPRGAKLDIRRVLRGTGRTLRIVLTHAWIRRGSGAVGLAHAGVFYGFLALFAGTVILTIEEDIAVPLGWGFWHGRFYEWYSLLLDIAGAAMLAGLIYFGLRRARGLARLDYARVDNRPVSPARARYKFDDWVFLWALLYIGATGFLLGALRIAIDLPSFEVWSPIAYLFAMLLRAVGISGHVADMLRTVTWWFHGVVCLGFIASIPFTKALHIFTGPTAVAVRDENVSRKLPDEPQTGYAFLADFLPGHKLDLDACTKCGRCHEVCPARSSGMPLSPRDVVLDLREAQKQGFGGALVPEIVAPETLWSCMQCNACVAVCPVGIEQVPIINLLRRGLVEAGQPETSLQPVFQAVQTTGNSFGESRRKRARWTKELDFEVLDARKQPVDVLWFVGDYASMDQRNQRNTRALAQILTTAGVNFGILYKSEQTAGNDVRRAAEEGLFRSLAAENIKTLAKCTFNRILTSDPHSYNTLRNEYPGLGANWSGDRVVHHSAFLLELMEGGRLIASNPLGRRATYHDPCALGRYNGIFEQPRELIRRCGVEIVEMPRNRSDSFCCGAGGGRIWMKEPVPVAFVKKEDAQIGSARPSVQRIDEAIGLGSLDYFIVACPKDVAMYDDAIKTSGHAEHIQLKEISELVSEAIGLASSR